MYIVVENLVKKYNTTEVLRDINLVIDKPIIYGLLGPNGAGKSTLMNIIAGVLKPTSGKAIVLGKDANDPSIKTKIGYCTQEPALYEHLSGWDNIYFFASLYGVDRKTTKMRAEEILGKLGILDYANTRVGKYSGGMKKKLALAISLIHDPEILILDEPTTGVDPGVRRSVWELLFKLRDSGKVIILATHYMEEADVLSNIVGIIDQGRLIAEGIPEDLKKKYGPPSVVSIELYSDVDDRVKKSVSKVSNVYYFDGNVLKIHVQDPDKKLPVIIDSLYEVGVSISSIKVIKPTLEDVFIKLTGRRLI